MSFLHEFTAETIPQIIIQNINNTLVYGATFSAKGNVSSIFSCLIAADGIYRYGYYLIYRGMNLDDMPLPLPVRVIQMLNASLKDDIKEYIDGLQKKIENIASEIAKLEDEIKRQVPRINNAFVRNKTMLQDLKRHFDNICSRIELLTEEAKKDVPIWDKIKSYSSGLLSVLCRAGKCCGQAPRNTYQTAMAEQADDDDLGLGMKKRKSVSKDSYVSVKVSSKGSSKKGILSTLSNMLNTFPSLSGKSNNVTAEDDNLVTVSSTKSDTEIPV